VLASTVLLLSTSGSTNSVLDLKVSLAVDLVLKASLAAVLALKTSPASALDITKAPSEALLAVLLVDLDMVLIITALITAASNVILKALMNLKVPRKAAFVNPRALEVLTALMALVVLTSTTESIMESTVITAVLEITMAPEVIMAAPEDIIMALIIMDLIITDLIIMDRMDLEVLMVLEDLMVQEALMGLVIQDLGLLEDLINSQDLEEEDMEDLEYIIDKCSSLEC